MRPFPILLHCTIALPVPTTEKHFTLAIEGYTRAIELNPNSAVYYSNRAFAHTKLEAYGSAIADATKAIELEPAYVKVGERVLKCGKGGELSLLA